jgi:hypothetical protein
MKHFKMLGLIAVALAVPAAFAATASATHVTTTTGGAAATPTIHATNGGGHIRIANAIATIECSSTIEGKIESHGTGVTAKGNLSTLNLTSCTNSWHVTSTTNGSIEIHYTSGHNGLLTSSGMQIDATRLGVTCVYNTLNTPLGTVTGGNPAIIHINGWLPLNSGLSSGLCGSGPTNAQILGSYITTSSFYVAS